MGLLLDRFGPRRVLVAGALLVAIGQGLLALAGSLPWAIGARVLVGAGDATAFIGALRLIPAWFPLGRVPMMSQIVSVFGQCGQVVSAVPFVAVLRAGGWERAFAAMSGLGLAVALIALAAASPSGRRWGASPASRARGWASSPIGWVCSRRP